MKKIIILFLALVLAVSVFAGCTTTGNGDGSGTTANPGDATPTIQEAKTYLRAMYKDNAEITPDDYTVVNAVRIGETEFTVEWSVNVISGSAEDVKLVVDEENMQTKVDVNTDAAEDTVYELKATIKDANGNTEELTFNHKVPKFKELSWAEYIAKVADEAVTVKGVITGIVAKSKGASNNCIYFQDNDGGYYAYQMSTDPITDNQLEIGMTIRVRGVKDIYSGTHEIKNGTVEILDPNKTAVTPADYTEIFKNAKSLKDSALVNNQSFLVTLKGVEIKAQDDTVSSGYFKFQLGEHISYIRISSSTCPLTKAEQTAFKKAHGEHTGWTANVTGVISIYDGAFYLTPVDANAIEYVSLPAKDDAGMVAFEKENLSFTNTVTEDKTFELASTGAGYKQVTITWVSDNACAVVNDGKLVVTLPEEETTVKLTATITCGSVTDTKEFEIKVDAAPTDVYVAKPITEVVADKGFKFALYQTNLGKTIYFSGAMSGNFFATTDKTAKAVDVYAEAVEGGYKLYFLEGETKKYLDIYEYQTGKVGVRIADAATATAVYTWNADLKIFVANVAGNDYYLGTYKTYNTISASKTTFITGDKAADLGVSQFVAQLCTLVPADYVAEAITEAKEGDFYFVINQVNLAKTLYFIGTINASEYLETADRFGKAVKVTVAKSGEGYTLKVGDKFIEVYENAAGKVRVTLVDASTGVWTWNNDLKLFTYTLAGCTNEKNNGEYYLGTYNNFDTISASKTSYITGDNASKVGVSQFPAYLSTVTVKELVSSVMEAPVADKAFKFALTQVNLDKTLYFSGAMSGNFFATTDKTAKAVDVYAEAVEGGYKLYFLEGETKKYLDIYEYQTGKVGVRIADAATATAVYTWNADLKIFVANVAGNDYYLGTYKTYNTISASKTTFITGDNAANVGVSQFVAQLVSFTIG